MSCHCHGTAIKFLDYVEEQGIEREVPPGPCGDAVGSALIAAYRLGQSDARGITKPPSRQPKTRHLQVVQ